MDSYKVVLTSKAREQLADCINYIQYVLKNEIAARSVYQDAAATLTLLSTVAGSLPYCSDARLKSLGYRLIPLQKHNYVMLYRTEAQTAYVEALFHRRQDYEHLFASEQP